MRIAAVTPLATIRYRLANFDLTASRDIGRPDGYDTLADAVSDARSMTAGPATAAAAVLERAGRFQLVSLLGAHYLSTDDTHKSAPEPFCFVEYVATGPFPQLVKDFHFRDQASTPIDPSLRAVVDGQTVLMPPVPAS